ncbi:MAG: 50S ribosomal protein L4 [Nanoarchaeota archaeon]|nr:50S ribosomal protein L4 [Nanoarchaeota archaeon]
MKLEVVSISKMNVGKKDLPHQFNELIRPDLIKRAVEVIQANRRQPYGSKDHAGMRQSAELSRRRKAYRGSYGKGISRVQRKIMTRRGTQMYMVGAVVPGTVGGRKAHPPKSFKIIEKKINKKEKRKAIRSAISATVIRSLVEKRGHKAPKEYPFIVENKIEGLTQTKKVKECFEKLGFKEELERISVRKIRAGRGKLRGRKYKTKKGPLIVVSNECPLMKTASNMIGVDVIEVHRLNAEALAPGADIGRLTIFTEGAIDRLTKEGLFMNDYKGQKQEKVKEAKPVEKKKKAEKTKKAPAKTEKAVQKK